MARKSGFVRRHGKMVRETAWFGGVFTRVTMAAASTAVITTSLNAAALALRPFTIVRTRGVIHLRSDQLAAREDFAAIYGNAVVSDQAVAIGVTAVPTPVTDNASDLWFVNEAICGSFGFITGSGSLMDGSNLDRTFDSKAMRKVEDGQDVIGVVETSGGSDGAIMLVFRRMLVKLHRGSSANDRHR